MFGFGIPPGTVCCQSRSQAIVHRSGHRLLKLYESLVVS
jgi:hypothetical protein